jgi:adenosyl cobinamide kinase/adenosyl cobinamide phosphate guanylyltransferase
MPQPEREFDIARNVRMLEWLRAELVGSVAGLLKTMIKGGEEALLDCLAGIIITTYLLGKRIGINFSRIDQKMESKIKLSIEENHEIENWYGDLTALSQHLTAKKR